MDRPTLTPSQTRLAEDATAAADLLRRRARNLEDVNAAFCAGRATEDELRRAIRESQCGG